MSTDQQIALECIKLLREGLEYSSIPVNQTIGEIQHETLIWAINRIKQQYRIPDDHS